MLDSGSPQGLCWHKARCLAPCWLNINDMSSRGLAAALLKSRCQYYSSVSFQLIGTRLGGLLLIDV